MRDYFEISGTAPENLITNQLINEVFYYGPIQEFFSQHGLLINNIAGNSLAGEPDLVLIPENGSNQHIQFCQLKYRSDFEALKKCMREACVKYEKTDWCMFITQDHIFAIQNIYDNPYDIENRKVIE